MAGWMGDGSFQETLSSMTIDIDIGRDGRTQIERLSGGWSGGLNWFSMSNLGMWFGALYLDLHSCEA